jgi:hypothetical protein
MVNPRRSLLFDLLAAVAALLAAILGARAGLEVPALEELPQIEGQPHAVEEQAALLRFSMGSPARSVVLRPEHGAGWVAVKRAIEEGEALTLWVPTDDQVGWLSLAPDAWQVASGPRVLIPLADTTRWAEREVRLARVLCVALAVAAGLLLAASRLAPPARSKAGPARSSRSGVRAEVVVSGLLALLGGALLEHGWHLSRGAFDLQVRTGAIVERDLRSSDGRINALRLRLEGEETTFVLFRKGTPSFEGLVARLDEGEVVDLVTDADRVLEERWFLAGLVLKPRIHGVRLGGEELLDPGVTREALRGGAGTVMLAGAVLIALALRAVRGALA